MTKMYIGGVRGVGKTSICLEMSKRHPTLDYISDSQIMMAALGITSRYELWKTPLETRMEVRRTANKVFDKAGDIIVDGHYEMFPEDVPKFDVIVLISATTDKILTLRREDSTRLRQLSLEEIGEEVKQTLSQIDQLDLRTRARRFVEVTNEGTKIELLEKVERLWSRLKEK